MNLSISHLRKSQVRSAVSLDQQVGGDGQSVPLGNMVASGREPSPTSGVETKEQVAQLEVAIQRLEVDLRSVLLLRDLQDMDYKSIAEILALPIGTVKSRLFRARLALRQSLEGIATAKAEGTHG